MKNNSQLLYLNLFVPFSDVGFCQFLFINGIKVETFLFCSALSSQVFLCVGEGCTDNDTNILHYYHIALALLTGFLFATHLPERLAPGSFDYIGKCDLRSSCCCHRHAEHRFTLSGVPARTCRDLSLDYFLIFALHIFSNCLHILVCKD